MAQSLQGHLNHHKPSTHTDSIDFSSRPCIQEPTLAGICFAEVSLNRQGFSVTLHTDLPQGGRKIKENMSLGIKKICIIVCMYLKNFMFASLHFQLQQLKASHCAELGAARKTNSELQDRLQSMTSEVLQLKSTLVEVSTERDGLKEHLRCHIQSKTEES